MEVPAQVEECQSRGTKRKREDVDLSLASTQYGVRLFSFLPPQADQVTIKEEKQNPSQVYHWRYAQSEEHPRKKHKKEDKAAAIIKKVLKSHTPKDRNTNDKMKISNLLCGTHVPAPEKVILSLMQSLWSVFNMMPINSPRLNRILCKQQIIRNTKSSLHLRFMCNTSRHKLQSTNSKPTSSILNQIHQKYSFPLESSSQINFAPVISFDHSALTANALKSKSLLSR
jgi:hypothetical protein